mgnify:CR=1 FL=1
MKNQKLVFIVSIENGNPICFEVGADFIGPKIAIAQPEANFGLVRSYTNKSIELDITNLSDVEAEILIRKKGDEVSFEGKQIPNFYNPVRL